MSTDALRSILESHGLAISSLERLSEGWDFTVYRMNHTHILRVPKRRHVVLRARDEIAFLNDLRPHTSVGIPNYDIVFETDETNGLLIGYPILTGSPLEAFLGKDELEMVIRPLAMLLFEVHRLGKTNDITIGSHSDVCGMRERASAVFSKLSPHLNPHQHETISFELANHVTLQGSRVPIHNDLRPDHILVGTGRIAVIDWTDIAWGFPWEDFLYLWICYGDWILRSVEKHYCGWERDWDRNIRTAGTWKAILEWDYATQSGDEAKAAFVEQFLRRCSAKVEGA